MGNGRDFRSIKETSFVVHRPHIKMCGLFFCKANTQKYVIICGFLVILQYFYYNKTKRRTHTYVKNI